MAPLNENLLSTVGRNAAPAVRALDGRNVLVVEDEYMLALDIQHHLELSGANVLGPVGSVEDALSVVKTLGDLDAAVLDLSLRDDKAYAIADALRALGVPFLFATGYDLNLVPERYSGVPVCQKPVSGTGLTAVLTRIVNERS